MTTETMQSVILQYQAMLGDDAGMTEAERAGYLYAASGIDPRIPRLTIEEAREIVAQATRREGKG